MTVYKNMFVTALLYMRPQSYERECRRDRKAACVTRPVDCSCTCTHVGEERGVTLEIPFSPTRLTRSCARKIAVMFTCTHTHKQTKINSHWNESRNWVGRLRSMTLFSLRCGRNNKILEVFNNKSLENYRTHPLLKLITRFAGFISVWGYFKINALV